MENASKWIVRYSRPLFKETRKAKVYYMNHIAAEFGKEDIPKICKFFCNYDNLFYFYRIMFKNIIRLSLGFTINLTIWMQ